MERAKDDPAALFRRLGGWTVRLMALLGRVRPDERRDVAGAFLTLMTFIVGHALLETARDALFLASLPARRLPWVYLAIAVGALAIGHREPRVVRKLSARGELGRWLLAAAGVTALFWVIVGGRTTWALYALYVWSGVIASLVVVRFWTILAARFTVTQAKRVFPVIASGSVVGAIVGSALARLGAELFDPRHLVLAASAAFAVASAAPWLLDVQESSPRRRSQWSDFGEVGRTIWSRPYLLRVTVLVLLATVTFTLVDFVFKSTADRLVPPDELGAFFASTYLAVNILSLLAQVGLVAWLLRHFGLVSAVAFVPAVMLVTTLGFAVVGGLGLALALKGADGALRHSLYRTGTELLFVPLSDRLRGQVKGLIDVLGQRGGQALASVVILMLLSTPADESTFAVLACLTSVAWLLVAVGLREHYLDVFRATLHPHPERTTGDLLALDLASLETLLATLNTADERRVVAALDILEAQGKAAVVPAPMLYHPSPAVVERTLDLFVAARRDDALALLPHLMGHADPSVRAAALRASSVLSPNRALFEEAAEDPDPRVAITGRVALVSCGWGVGQGAGPAIIAAATTAEVGVARAAAEAIRVRPSAALEPAIRALLGHPDPEVARTAIGAASELRAPDLLDPLIEALSRRAVREEARLALATFGALGLARLAEVLADREAPYVVRCQVPAAIASVGASQAPAVLLRHLHEEPDGLVRFKVLRALGRWRREQPGFPLDTALLQDALGHALSTGFRMMEWRRALTAGAEQDSDRATEVHGTLEALLRDKQDHALERAFRLLNLQSGSEEFQRVYRGLHSPLPKSRAGSRELLAHMVVSPVREPLLTLVDDLAGDRAPERPFAFARDRRSYSQVVQEIVSCGIESASSLAAIHALELGLVELAESTRDVVALSEEHHDTLERVRVALEERRSA